MRLILLFLTLSLGSYSAYGQDNKPIFGNGKGSESAFTLPDSLRHLSPWHTSFRSEFKINVTPAISMSSVVLIEGNEFPSRIDVINKNTLRIFNRVGISNGQAWNWGPFQNSYLDARTISLPMPR